MTRREVALMLDISERHLRDLEFEHRIPVLRLGRCVRYDDKAIEALKAAARSQAILPRERRRRAFGATLCTPTSTATNLRERLIAGMRRKKLPPQ